MPAAAVRVEASAPARAGYPGIAEPEGRGPPPVRVCGRVRDPLKGRTREDCRLAGALCFQYAPVDRAGLVLELVQVGQPGVAGEVAGAVDDGLDPQRPALFQVLLDPRVLVEDVHDHALVGRVDDRAVDGGAEGPGGVAADPAAEDDLDVLRAAEVKVVGDERLEEQPGPARGVEDDGPGDLDLPHRALPPVAGVAVRRPKGMGMRCSHRCAKTSMVPAWNRSQISCSPAGLSHEANPLASSVNPMPALTAWRLARSCPLTQILAGKGSRRRP